MEKTITLIIADDHPLFREGIRKIVSQDFTLTLLAEAGNGEEALRCIQEHSPNVAMLDIRMPKMSGLAVAREVFLKQLETEIVLLTNYDDEKLFDAAMEIGVRGYILKECESNEMVNAIHTIVKKKYYIGPTLSKYLTKKRKGTENTLHNNPTIFDLTEMERTILRNIAEGKTSKEIAKEWFISIRTVDNHRANIGSKLNLHGGFSVLKFALENKLVL